MASRTAARERLIEAAVEAFAEKGYHGTTTRDIARRVGMSPAALYTHHESKESLLFDLSHAGHKEALATLLASANSSEDPAERLHNMVFAFTHWHAVNTRQARINQYELRALSPEHLEVVSKYRRDTEEAMRGGIRYGIDRGAFKVDDVAGTALAILSLGIDLVRWFQPTGPRSALQIANLYAELALRMVGVD